MLYDWRVFQKRLSSNAAEIQEIQTLLDANALVLTSNAVEIQKTQVALDANEEDAIPEVPVTAKEAVAAQKPFESDPTKAKSMAEETQARRAQMVAKKAMVPYTCCALWVDQQA